ncbi:succinylglutamate desuccinylase/aspartoacylase family protein [Massilia arenosa]|uniref:Succinylglutamate desuccinylase/aspartoacylase family protein n=1 Tax=Zemynaea arenosa TaxID=2561931 RepID=A0A4Y9RSB7_9BURK|nr:succinylglutamate desuccinylase/aspartoacylase family protein [Massilia arenosa]TFW10686.1 succinylglutamate desuccinylase/aspartoacylase family protein [Massilia arenosa]
MKTTIHPISTDHSSVNYKLTSFTFDGSGFGKKAYIQAAVHADEVPGLLVAHVLRQELEKLESEGRIKGTIVLVPAANPIGLAQSIHGAPFGRFDLSTGTNFNRAYKHVADDLKVWLDGKLTNDARTNVETIRMQARRSVDSWRPETDTEVLKKHLLGMAIDADIVLDLHCDTEAVVHIYAGTPLLEAVKPLAAVMGAHAVLLALAAGGEPFDEACSRLWWDLQAHFGPDYPIPPACVATTVELRGERDVSYELARQDAHNLLQYLGHEGLLDIDLEPLPEPLCQATPLEGVEPIRAPHSGVLVYHKKLGDKVEEGDALADLIDPVNGTVTTLRCHHAGVFFARSAWRHVLRGMNVGKVAGEKAFRVGLLLSA